MKASHQGLLLAGAIFAAAASGWAMPADAETVAVLQGLDKTTVRISTLEVPVDRSVRFGTLLITVRACVKRPPEEPPQTAAFLEIDEVRPSNRETGGRETGDRETGDRETGGMGAEARAGDTVAAPKRLFSGWMFAQSPAISALEDPVYDVNLLDCKTEQTAAPSRGSKGK